MKVLLVNKYWYPRGGAEVVAMMTKTLLEKAGHETAVFAMQHPKNEVTHELFPPEIDYRKDSLTKKVRNSLKTISNGEAKFLFEKMVKEFQPDVVHFHNIYHQLSFALLEITKKYNIRAVMTLHDYKLLSPNYSLYHHGKIDTSIMGQKYYRCLLKNCLESIPESLIGTLEAYYRHWKKYHDMIDMYISPSEFLKTLFVQAGWRKEKIAVIRNPIELPTQTHSLNFFEKNAPVTYIGRLSEEKGLDVLLQAAETTPEIQYAFVGTGPAEHHLRSVAIHKKMKHITFYGWKTGSELEALYQKARLFVLPSVWYENAPLGISEAKAHKKIVLASRIGGIPEMLAPEFLFTPGDSHDLAQKIKKWYYIPPHELEDIGQHLRDEVKKENDPNKYREALETVYAKEK